MLNSSFTPSADALLREDGPPLGGPSSPEAAAIWDDGFERQVARHRESIVGLALRLTRSRDDAEDLAQEAIARAHLAYPRFEGTNFRGWMLRIVANLHVNRYHAARRRPAVTLNPEKVDRLIDDAAESAEGNLVAASLGDEVHQALAEIPAVFARAVTLIDVQNVGYTECARREEVPIGTVRSRLARGRALLREKLRAYAEREGYFR